MEHVFIRSAIASSTRLTTNAPVLRMCLSVSFGVPSGLDWMPRTTRAGSSLNTLKNERRRVYNAVLTDGGDERYRARRHERGQELVAMRYRQRAEINLKWRGHAVTPGGDGMFPVGLVMRPSHLKRRRREIGERIWFIPSHEQPRKPQTHQVNEFLGSSSEFANSFAIARKIDASGGPDRRQRRYEVILEVQHGHGRCIYSGFRNFGSTCSPKSSTVRTGSDARLTVSINRLAPASLAASACFRHSPGVPQIASRPER
jgi:hypothetical protein